MPDPNAPETTAGAKADAIEAELQTSIDEAKSEVASDAATAEEKRLAQERIDSLETRLAAVERTRTDAVPAVPVEAPATPSPDDAWRASVDQRLTDIAALVQKPVETVGEVAEAVAEPVVEAAEAATEVVESLPRRTHTLFKPLFGGGRDG